MKKKIIILAIAAAILCVGTIGATLAYFQDSEFEKNIMTVGNVSIVQNEQEQGDNGLQNFNDNKGLFPVTGGLETTDAVDIGGTTYQMGLGEYNYVDKIVTVTNDGELDAYVRTVFAFEKKIVEGAAVDTVGTDLEAIFSTPANLTWVDGADFTLDGVEYVVGVYYYNNDSIVASGATTEPSLLQVYLNSNVGNEWYEAVGEEYNILALSQAAQTAGFASAANALDTAFGQIDSTNCAAWFAPLA